MTVTGRIRRTHLASWEREGTTHHVFDVVGTTDDGDWWARCYCGDTFTVADHHDLPGAIDAVHAHVAEKAAEAEYAAAAARQAEALRESTPTDADRFNTAAKAIRKAGVRFRRNIRKCCNGCITPADLGMGDDDDITAPYGYTFGSQGHALVFDDDGRAVYADALNRARRSYYYDGRVAQAESVMVHHGEPDDVEEGTAARVIVQAFRDAGLDATWTGEMFRCVEVRFGTINALVPTTTTTPEGI